ncbi:MAG: hypothetical protein DI589_02080 [Shinella sp.]|nr:MAG: hypothetical protein DI589_02080 [Shinella sp.]
MTDLDVSMRLRLVNQLSKPAKDAEQDLKELRSAAERLGQSKGGGNLAGNLEKVGKSATEAKGKIGAVGKEADELRQKISRVDDGAFTGLKSDARSAEQAINRVGQAATELKQKLASVRAGGAGSIRPGVGGPLRPTASGGASALEGMVDRFGVPIALGTGLAYTAGGTTAGAALIAGAAINAAAGDEQRSDYLRITGGFGAAEQARIDAQLARIGARHGIGTEAAQGVFGGLQAGGLSSADASAMTDNTVVFSKATQAEPNDAANLTVALRNNMGIKADQMMSAYDAIALGGKAGQFEVKDMARNFPSILARLGSRGSSGMDGVRLATAFAQSVRKRSGTSDEASTSLEAMLSDMVAPDVVDRAKGYGVDTYKELASAESKGKDPVIHLLNTFRKAFGSDPEKFDDVIRNDTAKTAYRAVFDDWNEIEKMMREMEGAKGVISEDYKTATDNFNSQKDRLSTTIGTRVKASAAPVLPALTKVTKGAADALQRAEDSAISQRQIDAMVKLIPEGAGNKTGESRPSALKRFLFGKGAEQGFDLKQQLGIDLKPAADAAMEGYRAGITNGGKEAEAEARSIVDSLRSIFNFTATPTISPVLTPPATAPAGEKHSSIQNSSNVRLTQNISTPNAKLAAIRSRREQSRAIQQAQARSLYDLGPRPA